MNRLGRLPVPKSSCPVPADYEEGRASGLAGEREQRRARTCDTVPWQRETRAGKAKCPLIQQTSRETKDGGLASF